MTQGLLFDFLRIPDNHIEWFRIANAGDYYWKRGLFYPFKSRFLAAHALPDGYDLQIIKRMCHACDGTGIWHGYRDGAHAQDECDRCVEGIYDTKRIWLRRFRLGDAVFHVPETLEAEPKTICNTLDGLIKHDAVPMELAERCMARLLIRYEPWTWVQYQKTRFNFMWSAKRFQAAWKLRRLFSAMQRLRRIPPDEVPF